MDVYRLRRLPREPASFDSRAMIAWARWGLGLSAVVLAAAPLLVVGDGYSFLEHTLSESGGQGVEGAWLHRTGVLLASGSVFVMTVLGASVWNVWAKRWHRLYALALISLVAFPESSFDGSPYDPVVAKVHTCAGVVGAIGFVCGIVAVSRGRSATARHIEVFDWIVVGAVLLIPQAMIVLGGDGFLQRVMVGLGYIWLFLEYSRVARLVFRLGDEGKAGPFPMWRRERGVPLTE